MADRLRHRGPDDSGIYLAPGGEVGLSHRRLSIIDLSPAGHQPMSNAEGSVWLVYNGEIYNYRELDADLKGRGYHYRSRSDTETIVHAYEEWGEDCVGRFNGMFAFALWDEPRRRLFCARDRFGEKPFYYHWDGERLLFASEIKGLLCDPSVPRQANAAVVDRYLRANLADVDETTFFEGIQSLPAAHTLKLEGGTLRIRRYWDLPAGETDLTRSDEEWAEQFLGLLRSSIALRLRSDVPLGTCLSGGLDSSAIIGLMARLQETRVAAFSVLYDEPGFSERPFVRAVEEGSPVDAHEVTPDGSDLMPTLEQIVWHNDEPATSPGQYSQWHVMKLAAAHGVTVILNGQGGDELLAGYDRYIPTYVRELLMKGRLARAVRELRGDRRLRGTEIRQRLKQVAYPLLPGALRRLSGAVSSHRRPSTFLLEPDDGAGLAPSWHPSLRAHLACDLTRLSVPTLVHSEDRCSMAFSREIRLPFLDHRLVELMQRVPPSLKLRDGSTKYILRRAMAGQGLPEAVLNRHDKKGYPTPVGKWLAGVAREGASDLLNSSSFRERGLVDVGKAREAFERHCRGEEDFTIPIWQWLNLELWFRRFLD